MKNLPIIILTTVLIFIIIVAIAIAFWTGVMAIIMYLLKTLNIYEFNGNIWALGTLAFLIASIIHQTIKVNVKIRH